MQVYVVVLVQTIFPFKYTNEDDQTVTVGIDNDREQQQQASVHNTYLWYLTY